MTENLNLIPYVSAAVSINRPAIQKMLIWYKKDLETIEAAADVSCDLISESGLAGRLEHRHYARIMAGILCSQETDVILSILQAGWPDMVKRVEDGIEDIDMICGIRKPTPAVNIFLRVPIAMMLMMLKGKAPNLDGTKIGHYFWKWIHDESPSSEENRNFTGRKRWTFEDISEEMQTGGNDQNRILAAFEAAENLMGIDPAICFSSIDVTNEEIQKLTHMDKETTLIACRYLMILKAAAADDRWISGENYVSRETARAQRAEEALEKAKKNIVSLEKKLHDAKLQIAGLQQKIRKDDIKKARKKDKTES